MNGNGLKQDDLHILVVDDTRYETLITRKYARRKPYQPPDARQIRAIIPGVVFQIMVSEGQSVSRGQELMVIEAMKMKNALLATASGMVRAVHVRQGEMVRKNQLLIELA